MSIRILSASPVAVLLAALSLPAAALTCPPGEKASGEPAQCMKREAAKPQLDVEKYNGAQKAQAQACNKANAAHAAIVAAGDEITRLNTNLNAAQHDVQEAAKGPAKDAAKAKVADLKAKRKVEQQKLEQAQADELAGDKEYRKAARQGKKEKVEALDCL
ncbi:MAG TPA: hypothetical protein VNZ68_09800 [Rhodocyclaceae bacterium]|nr:hypothetical protein [Rhodocyclaceae bacterium]